MGCVHFMLATASRRRLEILSLTTPDPTAGPLARSHVLVTICLGGHIGLFCIDPKVGGLARQAIGDDRELPLPFATLPAGYLLNILVGGVLTFCGFNTLASKIASFIVGLCWIGVFLRVEVVAKLMTLLAVGLMVRLLSVPRLLPGTGLG